MSCLTIDLLARLEAGTLDAGSGAQAFAHLGSCSSCQELHREFFATANALKEVPADVLEARPRAGSWERIAKRLAEPAPASELPLAPGSVSIACTYCKGTLARREAVYCASCIAPHHGGCWEEHGRCAACAAGQLVRAEESRRREPRVARPVKTILVAALASAAAAALTANFTVSGGKRPTASTGPRPTGSSGPAGTGSVIHAAFDARARSELDRRQVAQAIADVRAALERTPHEEQSELHLTLARALELALDDEGALEEYRVYFQAGSWSAEAYQAAKRARATLLACRADRARVLDELARTKPGATQGDLFAEGGAERARREAIAVDASDDLLELVRLLVAKKDAAGAKQALAKLEQRDDGTLKAELRSADAECLRGEIALLAGDAELASAHYESALARDKESAFATAGLAAAYAKKLGEGEARTLFEKARALEAREGTATDALWYWSEGKKHAASAERFLDRAAYDQAFRALTRVLWKNPRHALARLERAKLLAAFRAWDLAVEDAEAALEADPFLSGAHALLGRLFAEDLPLERDPKTQRPRATRNTERGLKEIVKAAEPTRPEAVLALIPVGIEVVRHGTSEEWRVPGGYLDAIEALAKAVPTHLSEHASELPPGRVGEALRVLELDARRCDLLAGHGKLTAFVEGGVMNYPPHPNEAKTALARATLLATLRPRARAASEAWLAKAKELAGKDDRGALEALDAALALDPASGGARVERARALLRLAHPEAAARELAALVETSLFPGPGAPLSLGGLCDALDRVNALDAGKELAPLLDGHPESAVCASELRTLRAFVALARARHGASRAELQAARAAFAFRWGTTLDGALDELLAYRIALVEEGAARVETLGDLGAPSDWTPATRYHDVVAALARGVLLEGKPEHRDEVLDAALGNLSGIGDLAPSWERARHEPGLEALDREPRVQALVRLRREQAAARAKAPPRVLRLGADESSPVPSPLLSHVAFSKTNRGHDGAAPLEGTSPLGFSSEVLGKDAAYFLPLGSVPLEPERYDAITRETWPSFPDEAVLGREAAAVTSRGVGLVLATREGDGAVLEYLFDSPLGAVLPIALAADGGPKVIETDPTPLVTDEGRSSGIPWTGRTGTTSHMGVTRVRARAGATVLVRDVKSGDPLVVLGQAGLGRVLVVLGDPKALPVPWEDLIAAVARKR